VKVFLERDDNSRATTGKKEIGSLGIAWLTYIINLKLKTLQAAFPIHSWILKPTEKSRDSCIYVKCKNIQYQIDKLKEQNSEVYNV
jgi:hypothetical protein